jgi:predicted NACHT family NTPase
MKPEFDELKAIFDRINAGTFTDEDTTYLRRSMIIIGDQNVVQIGKYNINKSEGIDSPVLQSEIRKILHAIEQSYYDRSLRDYFRALRIYSEKFPYFTVADLLSNEQKDLDEVYVPLQTRTEIKEQTETFTYEQVSIDIMLHRASTSAKYPHALLLGEPGAGKSTLLRQIARRAWNDPASVGLDRPYLPMVIRLQSLALVEGVSLEERLINALRRDSELMLEQAPPLGFLNAWSQSMETNWLLILDGLDEVPTSQLPMLFGWLEDVLKLAATKRYHILLTSRPLDEFPSIFQKKFIIYELLPFSPEQQAALAEKWLQESKDLFLYQLARVRSGFPIGTPLLLTIAIAVFKKNGRLAEHTVEMYEKFMDILLTEAVIRGTLDELGTEIQNVHEGLAYLALIMTTNPEKTSLDDLSQAFIPYTNQIEARSRLKEM